MKDFTFFILEMKMKMISYIIVAEIHIDFSIILYK